MSNVAFCSPDNGEQALEVTEQLVDSGCVDLVVLIPFGLFQASQDHWGCEKVSIGFCHFLVYG